MSQLRIHKRLLVTKSLTEIVDEAADRFDARPAYRASIAARTELQGEIMPNWTNSEIIKSVAQTLNIGDSECAVIVNHTCAVVRGEAERHIAYIQQEHTEEIEAYKTELARLSEHVGPAAMLAAAVDMLAHNSTISPAKNFVEMSFTWDEGMLPKVPCRRATVTLYRDAGKTPGQMVTQLTKELQEVKAKLEVAEHAITDLNAMAACEASAWRR